MPTRGLKYHGRVAQKTKAAVDSRRGMHGVLEQVADRDQAEKLGLGERGSHHADHDDDDGKQQARRFDFAPALAAVMTMIFLTNRR